MNICVKHTADAAAETAAHLGEGANNYSPLLVSANKDEAKAVFEKALKDFPDNEKVKETKKQFMP